MRAPSHSTDRAPGTNGRSLSDGVVVVYAERPILALGILPGDRIVVHPSGAAMLTRMLPPGAFVVADLLTDRPAPDAPSSAARVP